MRIFSLIIFLTGILSSLFAMMALGLDWANEYTTEMAFLGKQCAITVWHPLILFSLALALLGLLLFLRNSANKQIAD